MANLLSRHRVSNNARSRFSFNHVRRQKPGFEFALGINAGSNPILLAVSVWERTRVKTHLPPGQPHTTHLAPTVCIQNSHAPLLPLANFARSSSQREKYKTARGPSSPLSTLQKHHHVHQSLANPQLPSTPLFFLPFCITFIPREHQQL